MQLNNKYYILRHGEAISNVRNVISSWPETFENPLTEKGKEQVAGSAEKLKNKNIDLIFASDVLRAKQTAQIVAQVLKLEIIFDARLRELDAGSFNGKTLTQWREYFEREEKSIDHSVPGGETYHQVLARIQDFLNDTDKKYTGKNMLIVSHQCPLWILEDVVKGFSLEVGLKKYPEDKRIGKGELRELN